MSLEYIKEHSTNPNLCEIISAPEDNKYNLQPDLFFWDPAEKTGIAPLCPVHESILKGRKKDKWCTGEKKDYQPRWALGVYRNVLIIARLYVCKDCGKDRPYRSTHPNIVEYFHAEIPWLFWPPHKNQSVRQG